MSGSMAKKLRRAVKKDDYAFLAKFREAIKIMPLRGRMILAWQILTKSFGRNVDV